MTRLQIVGGGNMGEALVAGLLAADWAEPADITIVEQVAARRDILAQRLDGVTIVDAPVKADGTVIAVKPVDADAACAAVRDAGTTRVLSIAAGVTTAQLERALGDGIAVVRAMPNTPALVRQGAAAIAAGSAATDDDLAWAEGILDAVGVVVRVPESQLDAVTGLSGSGPAYVLLLAEVLVEAGQQAGLSLDVTEILVRHTLLGAARLLVETGDPAPALRAAVTSPGGTTAEGIRVLEENGFPAAVIDAVHAATRQLARARPRVTMPTTFDTVSFLSDYGQVDEFVGVVKSVIRSIAPHVTVIDVSHDVAPHDVRAASLTLARSAQYLNPGVVLAVVDPGVGTDRRRLAVEVGEGESVLVGPDNGLLAPAVAMSGGATRAVSLTEEAFHLPAPGATFDGRDVFAPVAAHLCNGVDLAELGPLIDPLSLRPGILPITRPEGDTLVCEVLWVDHFGNAQLNVDPDELTELGDRVRLRAAKLNRIAARVDSYADIGPGEVGLVVDSYGLMSVALDRHSAAAELGLQAGDEVVMEPVGADDVDQEVSTAVRIDLNRGAGA